MTLTIQDLNINLKNNTLLNNLGLSIANGSCICFYGGVGSGKTALINVLIGETENKNILYNGYSILDAYYEYKTIMSYIPIYNTLDNELSVLQNLEFWGGIHNMESEIEAAVSHLKLTRTALKLLI